ncbi:MAG: translocation protein TolB [Gemmataceae bacterium]|nr:translocation protein TolB [Gemmataceae bacterium]
MRVWDVATGEQVAIASRREASVVGVQFTDGGGRLAVNFLDGYIRFYHPNTLAEMPAVLAPTVGRFDFSPDGQLVATRNPNGDLVVDELATGLPKLELPQHTLAAFHPDGKTIVASDTDGTTTLYHLAGGKPVFRVTHGGELSGLAVRPDGKMIATAGNGAAPRVKLWEIGQTDPLAEIPDASGPVAFIGTDQLVVTKAGGVGVYDLKKRSCVRELPGAAGAFAISPDGKKLATAGNGGLRVRIWDLTTGGQLHADGDALPDPAVMAPSPDGRSLFVIAAGNAFVWRVGEAMPRPAGTFPTAVATAAAGGGKLVVATGLGLAIWAEFDPSRPLPAKPTLTAEVPGTVVTALAVSPDGKWVAYSTPLRRITLLDATDGKTQRTLSLQTTASALTFSPKGDGLVVLGRDGFLRRWQLGADGAGDREVWKLRVQRGHHGAVAISPDGGRIAASSSGRMSVVDTTDGHELFALERPGIDGTFTSAAFSPDGRFLITGLGGTDGVLQVWELATRAEVRRYSTGLGGITRLAVFLDGEHVVSSGTDEAITVWDLSAIRRR